MFNLLLNTHKKQLAGFTLIETMIAAGILSIAFLGMAAVMLRVTYVQTLNRNIDEMKKLTSAKLSQMSHIDFSLLGTGTSADQQWLWGRSSGAVVKRGPLNSNGELEVGGALGPFKFTQSLVVCHDNTNGGSSIAGSPSADPCGNVLASRPTDLGCNTSDTAPSEARVVVLTTFIDRFGLCHKYRFAKTFVDFE